MNFWKAFIDLLIENGALGSAFYVIGHNTLCHVAGKVSTSVASGKLQYITGNLPWQLKSSA